MKKIIAGLLGWPVSQSLSPLIHSFFMRSFEIEGIYELLPVKPEKLIERVSELRQSGFAGLNVTIPHKKAVVEVCDFLSPEARAAGAVNTLVFEQDYVQGHNTDILGFRKSMQNLPPPFYILGKGGAAAAVAVALNHSDVIFITRQDGILAVNGTAEATVINATPLGWQDDDEFPFDVPANWHFVDLNYNLNWNWRNHLLSQVITGEKMLVEQAAESFRLWTGYSPDENLKLKVLERIREKLNEARNNQ